MSFTGTKSAEADLKYYEREGAFNIYTGYRQHNYHFSIYGALFLGQIEPALRANQGLWDTTPEEMLRVESPPMADYFESYMSMGPHILIRFGCWEEAKALELPSDPDLYPTLTATTTTPAPSPMPPPVRWLRPRLKRTCSSPPRQCVPETRRLHNNRVSICLRSRAKCCAARSSTAKATSNWPLPTCAAVELDDTLPYDEPWGWMQPTRHALGALLFEQGHVAEAEAVYREDLGLGGTLSRASIHPDNVWSLKGLCTTA